MPWNSYYSETSKGYCKVNKVPVFSKHGEYDTEEDAWKGYIKDISEYIYMSNGLNLGDPKKPNALMKRILAVKEESKHVQMLLDKIPLIVKKRDEYATFLERELEID